MVQTVEDLHEFDYLQCRKSQSEFIFITVKSEFIFIAVKSVHRVQFNSLKKNMFRREEIIFFYLSQQNREYVWSDFSSTKRVKPSFSCTIT